MSATLLNAVSAGRVIDERFPLLQELGGTDWTSAWLTELDDAWAQKAAIKLFPFESVDEDATAVRWDIARTLSHPHLMPLLDAGRCDLDGEDLFYVVTEYADETLSQILPERPLSPEEAREMLDPVLGALAYLHKLGLTHGHLRPTNIMVVDGQLKLSPDFGWRYRRRSIYDPPEAVTGEVTPAADIWSLGILLVEALTQFPPVRSRSYAPEPEIPASIPEPFFTICRECLRTDPERRCTLADIKTLLSPVEPEDLAVQTAGSIADDPIPDRIAYRTARPAYDLFAMLFAAAVLLVMLMVAAFKLGWDLTPSSIAPLPETALPAPVPPGETLSAAPTADPSQDYILRGSVADQVLPAIPQNILGAIRGHITVAIGVEVDPQGNVAKTLVESQGPSRYFATEARRAAQNWKFRPAQINGRAAVSSWLLKFQFASPQVSVTPSEVSP
jgi:TonB family protein